jgi:hypothetical protein
LQPIKDEVVDRKLGCLELVPSTRHQMVTMPANELVAEIHDRIPLILASEATSPIRAIWRGRSRPSRCAWGQSRRGSASRKMDQIEVVAAG